MKTLLLLLLPFTVFAQNEYGISSGINYTYFNNDITEGNPGIDFNLIVSGSDSDKADYVMEVGFSSSRLKYKGFDVEYNWLKVAFIPKYYIWKGLNFQAGPRIGYLLNGTMENQDIKSHKNFASLSALAGLGYRYEKYDISLRYNHGISELDENLRDRSVTFTAGIFF